MKSNQPSSIRRVGDIVARGLVIVTMPIWVPLQMLWRKATGYKPPPGPPD